MSRLLIIVVVGLASLTAAASQELSEAQKRANLVPFIRAAADCIVGAIPGNPAAVALARKGKWLDAAGKTGAACDQTVGHMIQAHDLAFGPGAGRAFFHGSFRSALPRALAQRVALPSAPTVSKPRIPVIRQSPVENADAEISKKKLLDAAGIKHYACIEKEMSALVPYSNESAETLATVIIGKCESFEVEQVDVAVAAFGYTREKAASTVALVTARTRTRIVGQIVTARAEAAKALATKPENRDFNPPAGGMRDAAKSY